MTFAPKNCQLLPEFWNIFRGYLRTDPTSQDLPQNVQTEPERGLQSQASQTNPEDDADSGV